jgi:hypothetical protein
MAAIPAGHARWGMFRLSFGANMPLVITAVFLTGLVLAQPIIKFGRRNGLRGFF